MARLDRQAVLSAALALGDESGLEAVTLRKLGERLGVTPMALYRHVGGKDDLLDGLADLLYGELALPAADAPWWDALLSIARSTRRTLLAHPWSVPLFGRPLAGPNGESLAAALEAALRRAGFSKAQADELHDQLANMVFALIAPELRGRRNRAAFERGLALLRPGLEARLRQE